MRNTRRRKETDSKQPKPMKYRCTWCGRDCRTRFCPRCRHGDAVFDKTAPHHCEWSRERIDLVKCKVCDKTLPMDVYLRYGGAPPQ